MILSMLAAPFIIEKSDVVVRRWSSADWMYRAMALHNIAAHTMAAQDHVIICGYGRSGQNLARLLEQESIAFIALDVDPQRVKEAAAAGESVVFGDAARREVLSAAGLMRAAAVVVSYSDTASALRILQSGERAAARRAGRRAYRRRQRHRTPESRQEQRRSCRRSWKAA